MSAVKLCKDCKHYVESRSADLDRCNMRPVACAKYRALVRGIPTDDFSFCDIHRSAGWLDARMMDKCGKEGRWWEEK